MAVVWNLPSAGILPGNFAPPVDPSWEQPATSFFRAPAVRTKRDTPLTDFSSLFGATISGQTVWAQYITEALDVDQTIDGTLALIVRGFEGSLAENLHIAYVARLIGPDYTVRGTLASFQTTQTEFGVTPETRIRSGDGIAATAGLAGDRIVMEFGFHGVGQANAAANVLRFGDPVGVANFALTAGLTTDLCTWFRITPVGANPDLTFTPDPTIALSSTLAAGVTEGDMTSGGKQLIVDITGGVLPV